MQKGYPIFKKENLLYEREEKEGFWTITPKFYPEVKELVINRTAHMILEFCDGKTSIEEIIDKMKEAFPLVESRQIQKDVYSTLEKFSRLLVVEWIGENPFLFKNESILANDEILMTAQEDDIIRIEKFINDSNIFIEDKKQTELFLHRDPLICSLEEYSVVSLRAKLFHFIEEFFLLEKDREIRGLISISLPIQQYITAANIKLVITPKDRFIDLLRYAQDILPNISIKRITKIRISDTNLKRIDPELENILLNEGYKEEAILQHELGFNNHLRNFVKFYSPVFIKKTEQIKDLKLQEI